MKKYLKDYTFLFSLAGVIVLLDQWTKTLVRTNLAIGDVWSPFEWLTPYARIVHWWNTGVAFGFFQNTKVVNTVLASVVALAIIVYFPHIPKEDWSLRLAIGMQLGGALGNLYDRLTIGHVTDFISVGNFAVFNIADSSITVGVGVLILGVWLQERRESKKKKEIEEQDLSDPLITPNRAADSEFHG
ncbi:MAG: signal peptidase II [Anaerolineaceae bacterium]|nr:signal peptidase II [Anaerolineaceae bacterium]